MTGALLVGKRCFAQILEGPASAVDEIFERRILPATSHTDVLLLSRGPTPARAFRDWDMAFVRDQTGTLDRFVERRAWEIETAESLSEPPSPWPCDLLFEELSNVVGHAASLALESMLTRHAVPDSERARREPFSPP